MGELFSPRFLWTAVLLATFSVAFAQQTVQTPAIQPEVVQPQPLKWAPVPPDANELVTSPPRALTDPQDRAIVLGLLDRARQNYNFFAPKLQPFLLKARFVSSGQLPYEGQGTMEQIWNDRFNRWTAKIGSMETVRIGIGRNMWSDDPSAPVPLRVQMARSALLWPVDSIAPRAMLRAADTSLGGKALICVLSSLGVQDTDQPRHWVEREYCVEPQNGNLVVWSEAPGHYVVYDYTSSIQFAGHVIAGDVTIYEAGHQVMKIHVDSIEDASGINPESLVPSREILAKGPSFMLGLQSRFPFRVAAPSGTIPNLIQPVIVHASLDRSGHVLEAEALQNSNPELAANAIDKLKSGTWGTSPWQREVFVDVEFLVGNQQVAAAQ